MSRRRLFECIAAIGLAVPAAVAAAQPGSQKANPLSGAMKQMWENARLNIKESADQMPEADYAFKPTPQVRSFGQIISHIAGANYVFCSGAKGEKSPHAEDEFEKNAKTKAEIVKALNDSFTYCNAAYDALTDARAAETITMPFGMGQGVRAAPLMANTGHLQEHYGNLVTYFRIKGMVPPSTRREQQGR